MNNVVRRVVVTVGLIFSLSSALQSISAREIHRVERIEKTIEKTIDNQCEILGKPPITVPLIIDQF